MAGGRGSFPITGCICLRIALTCHGVRVPGIDWDVQEASEECETWLPPARLRSEGPEQAECRACTLSAAPSDGPRGAVSGLRRVGCGPRAEHLLVWRSRQQAHVGRGLANYFSSSTGKVRCARLRPAVCCSRPHLCYRAPGRLRTPSSFGSAGQLCGNVAVRPRSVERPLWHVSGSLSFPSCTLGMMVVFSS